MRLALKLIAGDESPSIGTMSPLPKLPSRTNHMKTTSQMSNVIEALYAAIICPPDWVEKFTAIADALSVGLTEAQREYCKLCVQAHLNDNSNN